MYVLSSVFLRKCHPYRRDGAILVLFPPMENDALSVPAHAVYH